MKWFKIGPIDYQDETGEVRIMRCANAAPTPWKVDDNRNLPRALTDCTSFHRTLGEAKNHAEAYNGTPQICPCRLCR